MFWFVPGVANATFQGTSYLQYTNTLTTAPTSVTLNLRSRQDSGILLHVRGQDSLVDNYLTVQLVNKQVLVTYNLGMEGQVKAFQEVATGEWLEVKIEVSVSEVSLEIAGVLLGTHTTSQTLTLLDLLQNSDSVYVAGIPASARQGFERMFETTDNYQGCLGEIRFGSVLMPFFSQSDMSTSESAEQFQVVDLQDIEVNNCPGDPVCESHDCQNGATCSDVWNAYECVCVPGYNGSRCELNIDDCVNHGCQNGAKCEDGVQDYTCDCALGFTGDR